MYTRIKIPVIHQTTKDQGMAQVGNDVDFSNPVKTNEQINTFDTKWVIICDHQRISSHIGGPNDKLSSRAFQRLHCDGRKTHSLTAVS